MKRKEDEEKEVEYMIDKQMAEINKETGNKNVVLVHCAMGVSRSASSVIMYIMKKFGISYDNALRYVQKRRVKVDPNSGFEKQLLDFEKQKCRLGKIKFDIPDEVNQPRE